MPTEGNTDIASMERKKYIKLVIRAMFISFFWLGPPVWVFTIIIRKDCFQIYYKRSFGKTHEHCNSLIKYK